MPEPQLDRERYVLGDASQHVGFLNCERISERSHIHGWRVDPHYHEGLAQVFFFSAGEILGQVDFDEILIKAPALIWMPPLVSHGFDYPENTPGWVVTLPSVDLARLSTAMPWISSWLSRPAVIFGDDHHEDLVQLQPAFEAIEAEHARWEEERGAMLEALLCIALVHLHRCLRKERARDKAAPSAHLSLVNAFQTLVDRDHLRNRSVRDYAEELSVTATYLTRCVKMGTGRTAGEIIHDRLVLEARRLLVFSELSIAEIAYKLNFSTPTYFTRFFTARTGENPSWFRNRMRASRP